MLEIQNSNSQKFPVVIERITETKIIEIMSNLNWKTPLF